MRLPSLDQVLAQSMNDLNSYGEVTFLDASGNPAADQTKSAVGNRLLYGGWYRDFETGDSQAGHRTFSHRQGRFLNRDPIGIWGSLGNAGNGYGYAASGPLMGWDPWGLDDIHGRIILWLTGEFHATGAQEEAAAEAFMGSIFAHAEAQNAAIAEPVYAIRDTAALTGHRAATGRPYSAEAFQGMAESAVGRIVAQELANGASGAEAGAKAFAQTAPGVSSGYQLGTGVREGDPGKALGGAAAVAADIGLAAAVQRVGGRRPGAAMPAQPKAAAAAAPCPPAGIVSVQGEAAALRQVTFGTGHAAPHLLGSGATVAQVESAILQQMPRGPSVVGWFEGRVAVGNQIWQYRGMPLPNGTIHVGTYFPVAP